jgi:hypothetical protein
MTHSLTSLRPLPFNNLFRAEALDINSAILRRQPLRDIGNKLLNCINPALSKRQLLAFKGLFQHMNFVIAFRIFVTIRGDLANRMQHRGVIASAEQVADLGKTLFC